jgi:hypothetical protein
MFEQQQQMHHRNKQQATNKSTPGPLMRAWLQEMANVVQHQFPQARDLTPVQANDLLHRETRAHLAGMRLPFASLEDATPMFALQNLVLANATVNQQSATEIVSCSQNMEQFLGEEVQDQVEISEAARRSAVIAKGINLGARGSVAYEFKGSQTGTAEILFRPSA